MGSPPISVRRSGFSERGGEEQFVALDTNSESVEEGVRVARDPDDRHWACAGFEDERPDLVVPGGEADDLERRLLQCAAQSLLSGRAPNGLARLGCAAESPGSGGAGPGALGSRAVGESASAHA